MDWKYYNHAMISKTAPHEIDGNKLSLIRDDYKDIGNISMPLCLNDMIETAKASPIGYLLGSRVMLITNQERKMFISVSIGAIVSLIGNFILIKQFAEYGAAIALIISEIVIMIVYITFSHKYFKLIKVIPSILKVFTASIGMIVLLYIESQLSLSIYIKLLIQIISSAFVYFGILLLVKENTVSEYAIKFIKK